MGKILGDFGTEERRYSNAFRKNSFWRREKLNALRYRQIQGFCEDRNEHSAFTTIIFLD
jgi:hypothetical protein